MIRATRATVTIVTPIHYPGDDYDSPRPPYRDYYDRGLEKDPYGPRYESTRCKTVANDYGPISPRQPSLIRCLRSPSVSDYLRPEYFGPHRVSTSLYTRSVPPVKASG